MELKEYLKVVIKDATKYKYIAIEKGNKQYLFIDKPSIDSSGFFTYAKSFTGAPTPISPKIEKWGEDWDTSPATYTIDLEAYFSADDEMKEHLIKGTEPKRYMVLDKRHELYGRVGHVSENQPSGIFAGNSEINLLFLCDIHGNTEDIFFKSSLLPIDGDVPMREMNNLEAMRYCMKNDHVMVTRTLYSDAEFEGFRFNYSINEINCIDYTAGVYNLENTQTPTMYYITKSDFMGYEAHELKDYIDKDMLVKCPMVPDVEAVVKAVTKIK